MVKRLKIKEVQELVNNPIIKPLIRTKFCECVKTTPSNYLIGQFCTKCTLRIIN